MGHLIAENPPRLPGIRLMVVVGLGALLMVVVAAAASVLGLQHDQAMRRLDEDALAITHLAFDAESLASRLRAVQELGEQSGTRAPLAAGQLHEVLRAVDIDEAEWERRLGDAAGRTPPGGTPAALANLRTAMQALRATVTLPGDPPAAGAPDPAAAGAPGSVPPSAERAYLAAVEAAQGVLLAAVRAGAESPVFRAYTYSEVTSGFVAAASALALLLGLLLATLINRARHESRVAIGVMGQLLRTDPLTGIANRRGLDENLPVEMARAKRGGKTLTVAMLDLDFFKRYNSRRGHAGGDSLLRSAAQSWRKQLRPTDTLVRYGGEEFTLVLPSCDAEQACQLIDRLRPLLPDGQTFSAGVATWDTDEIGGPADAAGRSGPAAGQEAGAQSHHRCRTRRPDAACPERLTRWRRPRAIRAGRRAPRRAASDTTTRNASMNAGIAYALGAYLLWGLLPIYLHLLGAISTTEILAHRIVWSLATMLVLLLALRRLAWVRAALARPRVLGRFVLTAALISINWVLYIWSINAGHTVDASLGYFINPLVNVLVGAVLFGERLRVGQRLPVALAALGVLWLTWLAGAPPWIGLALALSFSAYGLLRKTAALGALEGFTVETALLAPLALGYLLWLGTQGRLGFAQAPAHLQWLLVLAGPVTTLPLLLFAAGVRRIPFSLAGVLQYVAPTLQWLTGIYLFHEAFDPRKAVGFGLIWLALVIYGLEGAWFGWRRRSPPVSAPA